jgi:hypothetical protein
MEKEINRLDHLIAIPARRQLRENYVNSGDPNKPLDDSTSVISQAARDLLSSLPKRKSRAGYITQ